MAESNSTRERDNSAQDPLGDKNCAPGDIALKSFFLGPQAENAEWVEKAVRETLSRWFDWRRGLFPEDGRAISAEDQGSPEFLSRRAVCEEALAELMHRFEGEVPKFSPRYLGHMFSEISLPALFGHIVAVLHNPNNVSGESSQVGIAIENEAIAMLARMVGFPDGAIGHFTSGGTLANFEAFVRARERFAAAAGAARPAVFVPASRHYSWDKGAWLLGLGPDALRPVALDERGRLSVGALREEIGRALGEGRVPMMVVSIAGSTELGAIDPVDEAQDVVDALAREKGLRVWHHVDAAYGGFFASIGRDGSDALDPAAARALAAMARADSVTLDPHKLGYVPYASGAFLCRDRADYVMKPVDAPYVGFDPARDRGPFTIEGSRSASGATSTWLTGRSIGFTPQGYGRILARTVRARRDLERKLVESGLPVRIAPDLDTNVLAFCVAREGEPVSVTNARTLRIYHAFSPGKPSRFFVSKTALRWRSCPEYLDRFAARWSARRDSDELALVRMCLLNPFFASVEPEVSYPDAFVEALREAIGA